MTSRTDRQIYSWTYRHTDIQANGSNHGWTYRETDIQTGRQLARQTDGRTNR